MNIPSMVNQCFRKKVFRSEKLASKVADKWNTLSPPPDGKVFHAYFCDVCFKYHVGRTTKEKK